MRNISHTTPDSAKAAGLQDADREWTEMVGDFIGPRFRAAFGIDGEELARVFQRQRAAGHWGDSDERCLGLIDYGLARLINLILEG